MKVSLVLFLVVGTALMFFNFLTPIGVSWLPDLFPTTCDDRSTLIAVSRKLKENDSRIRSNSEDIIGQVTLDDYHPIDPVPSSKASVKPRPIEHRTPLMPYIPKHSPPPIPKPGGSK